MKIGDVVRLKSGGPKMTVGKVADGEDAGRVVVCCWFEGSIFRSQNFPFAGLEAVGEEADGDTDAWARGRWQGVNECIDIVGDYVGMSVVSARFQSLIEEEENP